jgi:hypothetical protein
LRFKEIQSVHAGHLIISDDHIGAGVLLGTGPGVLRIDGADDRIGIGEDFIAPGREDKLKEG